VKIAKYVQMNGSMIGETYLTSFNVVSIRMSELEYRYNSDAYRLTSWPF